MSTPKLTSNIYPLVGLRHLGWYSLIKMIIILKLCCFHSLHSQTQPMKYGYGSDMILTQDTGKSKKVGYKDVATQRHDINMRAFMHVIYNVNQNS